MQFTLSEYPFYPFPLNISKLIHVLKLAHVDKLGDKMIQFYTKA